MIIFLLFAFCLISAAENYGQSNYQPDFLDISEKRILKQLISEIQELKRDRDVDRERIRTLENTEAVQNELILSLQKRIDDDNKGNTRVEVLHNHTDIYIKSQEKKKDSIRSSSTHTIKETKRLTTGQSVAFSSYLKPQNLNHLGAHQNVVFDETFVNLENVYNVHHGVFTVPVSGIYLITSTVLAFNNREVWCDIVVDGVVKAHVYARGTDGRHDQGTQTILLHLNGGDDVSVQNQAVDDAIYGEAYTTFSGVLLIEDEPLEAVG